MFVLQLQYPPRPQSAPAPGQTWDLTSPFAMGGPSPSNIIGQAFQQALGPSPPGATLQTSPTSSAVQQPATPHFRTSLDLGDSLDTPPNLRQSTDSTDIKPADQTQETTNIYIGAAAQPDAEGASNSSGDN